MNKNRCHGLQTKKTSDGYAHELRDKQLSGLQKLGYDCESTLTIEETGSSLMAKAVVPNARLDITANVAPEAGHMSPCEAITDLNAAVNVGKNDYFSYSKITVTGTVPSTCIARIDVAPCSDVIQLEPGFSLEVLVACVFRTTYTLTELLTFIDKSLI